MSEPQNRDRGGCLDAFLVVSIALNVIVVGLYILAGVGLLRSLHWLPLWAAWTLVAVGFINIGALLAIWSWRRWGLYAFVTNCVAVFALNSYLGLSLPTRIIGLVSPVLLALLVRPIWRDMK